MDCGRVHECGFDRTPIGLSVAVQFIEPRDSDLSENILGFFCTAREIFKTNTIEQVEVVQKPKRQGPSRDLLLPFSCWGN